MSEAEGVGVVLQDGPLHWGGYNLAELREGEEVFLTAEEVLQRRREVNDGVLAESKTGIPRDVLTQLKNDVVACGSEGRVYLPPGVHFGHLGPEFFEFLTSHLTEVKRVTFVYSPYENALAKITATPRGRPVVLTELDVRGLANPAEELSEQYLIEPLPSEASGGDRGNEAGETPSEPEPTPSGTDAESPPSANASPDLESAVPPYSPIDGQDESATPEVAPGADEGSGLSVQASNPQDDSVETQTPVATSSTGTDEVVEALSPAEQAPADDHPAEASSATVPDEFRGQPTGETVEPESPAGPAEPIEDVPANADEAMASDSGQP